MGRRKKNGVTLKKVSLKKVQVQPRRARSRTPKRVVIPRAGYGSAFKSLGGLAGGYVGGPYGASVGMSVGDLIARVTGFGDYRVNSNSISMGQSVPTFRQKGKGVTLCHREFVTDVVGSVNFEINAYAVQPGLSILFPWLSQIVANFEEYQMKGLVFEYRPSSGSAISSSSSALGVVILATNYDVLDAPFATKQAMESYEFSTSQVPFSPCTHAVECAPGANPLRTLFTRTGSIPSGADQRMYDLGLFQIATQGMQSPYTIGELWVTYGITLLKPRMNPSLFQPVAYNHYVESGAQTASATNPFGDAGLVTVQSTFSDIGISTGATSPHFLSFSDPNVVYVIVILWAQSASTITADVSVNFGTNLNVISVLQQDSVGDWGGFDAANAFRIIGISGGSAGSGTDNHVSFSGLTGLSGAYLDIYIFRVNPANPVPALRAQVRRLRDQLKEITQARRSDDYEEVKFSKASP